jgi:hypothetical protein
LLCFALHAFPCGIDGCGASSSEIEDIGSIDLGTDKRNTHLAMALNVNHCKKAFAPGAVTSAGVQ